MEFLFSQIKKMEVICLNDGKNLGRIYDAEFTMPDGKIKGFYLTGCKGFKLTKSDVYIRLSDVVKIGEDVILVRQDEDEKPCLPPNQPPCPPPCPPGPPAADTVRPLQVKITAASTADMILRSFFILIFPFVI